MAKLGEYFQYDDSSLYIWRTGDENDPFVDQFDTVKVIHNRGILVEIPDRKTRVDSYLLPKDHNFTEEQLKDLNFLENESTIQKLYEIDLRIYNAPKTPAENQFIVNYANGILTFHPNLNARDIVCIYKGVGRILITAERVWLHRPNPWSVDTLQGFADFLYKKENEIKEWISIANGKIDEIDRAIKESIEVINVAKKTIENCKNATNECIETTINSRMVWKPSIKSFLYINETYPFPEIGWTTICDDNGDVVRFDGSAWIKVGNIVGEVPLATPARKGLMSSRDKYKLDTIQYNAEPNLKGDELKAEIPVEVKMKSIIFTIPKEVRTGDAGYMLQAPFEGKIIRVVAFAQSPSIAGEWGEFSILKSSLNKLNSYDGWEEITDKYNRIRFLGNSRLAEPPQLLKYDIGRYDLFRIICTRQAEGLTSVTIQIDYAV